MPESTRERRSSRARPPVKTGFPAWIFIAGGAVIAVLIFLVVVYPVYHRNAVVKAAISAIPADREWAAREALSIGCDKLLDPLVEAADACPPEAAPDLMNIILKLTERTTSEYAASKVSRLAEKWAPDASPQKRLAAARGLTAYFAFDESTGVPQKIVESGRTALLKLVKDTEQAVRKEAIYGIKVPCRASAEIALAALSDTDLQVRRKAAEALMSVATPDAAQMLLTEAGRGKDEGTRATIIRALARHENAAHVGSSGFAPLLADPSPAVRKEAILAVSHCADPGVSDMLIKMLDDTSSEVRHEVIMNALYRRDKKVGLAAIDRLLVEPSKEVKLQVLKSVGPLSLIEGKEKIIAVALKKDEIPEVRTAALAALTNLNLTKPEEKYPMVERLMPAIEDENQEVSHSAQAAAACFITGAPPRGAAAWRQWMEEKRPIITLLSQIAELVNEGNNAYERGDQPAGDDAYFKAAELYDEIMKICPKPEVAVFQERQRLLTLERGKRQRSAIIDMHNDH